MRAARLSNPVSWSCVARWWLSDSARASAVIVRDSRAASTASSTATRLVRTTVSREPLTGIAVARIAGENVRMRSGVARPPRRARHRVRAGRMAPIDRCVEAAASP